MAGQTVVVSVLADTRRFARDMKGISSGGFVGSVTSGFRRIGSAITAAFAAGIAAVTTLGALLAGIAIRGGIARLLDIEDAQAKLRGLGHDAETVETIMGNALDSVRGTAFGLGEAATIAASAVASGVKPGEDLERTLKLVGDTATIAGAELNEMGAIFNKVGAQNRLTMQEVNQLATRGVPILQWLADQYGVTAEEASKMVSAGKVDFEAFRAAIEENISGAALESGETTRGAYRNTLAALSRVGANLLSGVFPLFRQFFLGVIDALGPVEDRAKLVGEAFAAWVDQTIPRVQAAVNTRLLPAWRSVSRFFTDTLLPALRSVRDWMAEHRTEIDRVVQALGPAAAIVGGLATAFLWVSRVFRLVALATPVGLILALATALVYAWQNSERFRDVVSGAWETVQRVVRTAWENVLQPILAAFTEQFERLWPLISDVLGQAGDLIGRIFGDIGQGLSDNAGGWEGWQQSIDDVASTVGDIVETLVLIIREKLDQLERFWNEHGSTIVWIVTFAWNLISALFTGGLSTISGLLKVGLGIMRGDWQLFWEGMQTLNRAGWNNLSATTNDTSQRISMRIAVWLVELRRDFRAKLIDLGRWWSETWNGIVEFVRGIPQRIIDALAGLRTGMARVGREAGQALVSSIAAQLSGSTFTLGGMIAGLAGRVMAREHGGPVTGGRPYIVGERGPELFVPSGSGHVVPNGQLGGGQTVVQVQAWTDRFSWPQVQDELRHHLVGVNV